MIRTIIASVGIVAGAISLAPPANADQYDFISYIDNSGVYYSSISDMIDVGKGVCHVIRANGYTVESVEAVIQMLTRLGYSDNQERGAIVLGASHGMCPDIQGALNQHMMVANNPAPPPPPVSGLNGEI